MLVAGVLLLLLPALPSASASVVTPPVATPAVVTPAVATPMQADGDPKLTVEPASARPGDVITVRLTGWSSVAATVTVCGNLAMRGSADCDVSRGQGVPLAPTDGAATLQVTLSEPPAPCPCVVRAASGSFDEVATARLDIIGAPQAPVVEPSTATPLISVAVDASRAPESLIGIARAALGGTTIYELTITLRNLTAAPLQAVKVTGAAVRSGKTVATFTVGSRALQPGEVYEHRDEIEVPGPAIGPIRWDAAASGAGPAAHAGEVTRHTPVALLALLALLAGDIAAMLLRRRRARERRRSVDTTDADESLREDVPLLSISG